MVMFPEKDDWHPGWGGEVHIPKRVIFLVRWLGRFRLRIQIHRLIFRPKNGMFFLHPWSSWWFFTNPFEKYARQNGNLPQIWVKIKTYLKPAPSGFLNCHMAIQNWSFKKLSMEISALVVGRGSKSRGTLKNLLIYMSMAIVINTSKIVHLKTALSRINSLSQ